MRHLVTDCLSRVVLQLIAIVLAPALASASDPTTADCLAASESAITLRNQHHLRAARSELLVCAAATCPSDVRDECARRVSDVNAQMPTIVFEAKDRDDRDLSAVSVRMDGQPLVQRLEGTALSIDPGEHQFVFQTDGAPPVERAFVIRESEKGRREKIVLGNELPLPAALGASAAPATPSETREVSPRNTQRIVGIALGGAAVVGLGVALVEQLTANSRDSDSHRRASSPDSAVQATTHAVYQQAKQAQTNAVVIGSLSAAALGVGLYLFVSSLGESRSNADTATSARLIPTLGPTDAGLRYIGAF